MGTKNFSSANDLITFSRSSAGTALRKIAYGPELVTNGTFDTDLSGWTDVSNGTALVEWVSGVASFDDSQGGDTVGKPKLEQPITGSGTFLVSFDTEADSSFTVQNGEGLAVVSNDGKTSRSLVVTATSSPWTLSLQLENSAVARTVDNISVKEVLFDQGTLTLFNHPAGIPRIEYDASGNVLGLLVEEARTNLYEYSEDFSQWTAYLASVSITTGQADLSGGTNAALVSMTVNAANSAFFDYDVTVNSGTTYTASFFAKQGNSNTLQVAFSSGTGLSAAYVNFNLENGTVAAQNGLVTADIENCGAGWHRCSVVFTPSSTNTSNSVVYSPVNEGNGRLTAADSGNSIYIYGAQLEAGAFPTSYIPTSGATATRAADLASIPVSAFGYNQSEGTVVVESKYLDEGTAVRTIEFHNSTSAQRTSIGGASYHPFMSGGANIDNLDVLSGQFNKIAVALKENDVASVANGSATTYTDNSVTLSVDPTFLSIGSQWNGSVTGKLYIKSIKYYPRRLTNAQLQELTQ